MLHFILAMLAFRNGRTLCSHGRNLQGDDLKKHFQMVWNVSFGGTFLLKSIFVFSVRAPEVPFSRCKKLRKMRKKRVKRDFAHSKNGTSSARTEKTKTLFNRNVPPKLTFHTSESMFGHSKVVFRPFQVVPL